MPASSSFNTDQFAWSDVKIQIGNRVLTGVQGIRYKVSQDKAPVYGAGNKPLTIQRGNYAFDGSIKLLQSELETLASSAPSKDMMRYRNLTVTIGYENEQGQVVVDNLVGVEFLDVEKAMEQAKMYMECDLAIIFLDVQNSI